MFHTHQRGRYSLPGLAVRCPTSWATSAWGFSQVACCDHARQPGNQAPGLAFYRNSGDAGVCPAFRPRPCTAGRYTIGDETMKAFFVKALDLFEQFLAAMLLP